MLQANDEALAEQIARSKHVAPWLGQRWSALEFEVQPTARGDVKQELIKVGSAEDLAGYSEGEALLISFRAITGTGMEFCPPPLSARCHACIPRGRQRTRRLGRHHAAVRCGQDHGVHGATRHLHAHPHHKRRGSVPEAKDILHDALSVFWNPCSHNADRSLRGYSAVS